MIARKNPPSGCYRDLYTNIPSKNFAFPDFPFPDETPTFITHQDVLAYFERYAKAFGLLPLIEFNTSVDQVMKTVEGGWELVLSRYEVCLDGLIKETRWREHFDAVVAASGMHQEPFVPNIKGLADYNTSWPLKVAHSKQFRCPEDYKDQASERYVGFFTHLSFKGCVDHWG